MSLLLVPVAYAAGTSRLGLSCFDQQSQGSVEEHLKKGMAAYKTKDFKLARDEAQQALKLKRDSPDANLLMGLALKNLRKSKDAIKYAKKAIQLRKDYPDAHYLLAMLFYETYDIKKAATELETAMHLGVKYANAYVLKGTLELLANQKSAALISYREALRLASSDNTDMAAIKERVAALEAVVEFDTHRGEPAYKPPLPLNAPMPHYTEDARSNHVQGQIHAAVFINEEGNVSTIVLLTTLGYGLDAEAVKAARQLRFSPAMKDGKSVPFWKAIIIEFNLR